jgi:vacuolar protein sorting-associated protein 13A/C
MLEPVLAYYLNQYLGNYVTGLDADSLRVSVWAGDVVLKDLKLRAEALEALKLPITVKGGVLGTLRLKVRTGPVISASNERNGLSDLALVCRFLGQL